MVSLPVGSAISRTNDPAIPDHSYYHGLSWSGIIAGAFAAAALALILISLGLGLGLSSISPWASRGVSSTTLAAGAIVWLILSQIIASGMGGYLAGRLRHRWNHVHTDEIYFRDTAQGFLAWSVGIVLSAALLGSAGNALVGAAIPAATGAAATISVAGAAPGVAQGPAPLSGQGGMAMHAEGPGNAMQAEAHGYYVDQLFRSDKPADSNDAALRAETTRIFAYGLRQGQLDAPDRTYLSSLVATRTGLSQADAEKRLDDTFARAKSVAEKVRADTAQAADVARKAAAHTALWLFVALLFGAFSASLFATIGGRHRDSLYPVVTA